MSFPSVVVSSCDVQVRHGGFDAAALAQGRQEYNSVGVAYDDRKAVVNKGNLFRLLWKFYTAHIQSLDPHVDRLAQWMLQTGHYARFLMFVISGEREIYPVRNSHRVSQRRAQVQKHRRN
jgi:hypothetical protein